MVLLIMCCVGIFLLIALINTGVASMEQRSVRLETERAKQAKNLREEMEKLELLEGRRLAMKQMESSDQTISTSPDSVDVRMLIALDEMMGADDEVAKLKEVSPSRKPRKKKLTETEKLHQENVALRSKMEELEKRLALRNENAQLKAKFDALEKSFSSQAPSIRASSEDVSIHGFVEELVVSHEDETQPLIEISLSDQ